MITLPPNSVVLTLRGPADRRQGEHVCRLAIGPHDERTLWRMFDGASAIRFLFRQ